MFPTRNEKKLRTNLSSHLSFAYFFFTTQIGYPRNTKKFKCRLTCQIDVVIHMLLHMCGCNI